MLGRSFIYKFIRNKVPIKVIKRSRVAKFVYILNTCWSQPLTRVFIQLSEPKNPKKNSLNSLERVNTLKSAWDRISGVHCLLLPQNSNICLEKDITYSLLTTSSPITLDELSHAGSRTPDPVRYSRSNSSLKKKQLVFQKFLKMDDSVCHHNKLWYWKFKDQIKLCKNNK